MGLIFLGLHCDLDDVSSQYVICKYESFGNLSLDKTRMDSVIHPLKWNRDGQQDLGLLTDTMISKI